MKTKIKNGLAIFALAALTINSTYAASQIGT
jgi:hypothetical protein